MLVVREFPLEQKSHVLDFDKLLPGDVKDCFLHYIIIVFGRIPWFGITKDNKETENVYL